MLGISSVNNVTFGAKPKFVGHFSKASKDVLKNLTDIKNFDGNITFEIKKGIKHSTISPSTTSISSMCKKLQMYATLGNRGKLLEVTAPLQAKSDILTDSFVKEYEDILGEILNSFAKWPGK